MLRTGTFLKSRQTFCSVLIGQSHQLTAVNRWILRRLSPPPVCKLEHLNRKFRSIFGCHSIYKLQKYNGPSSTPPSSPFGKATCRTLVLASFNTMNDWWGFLYGKKSRPSSWQKPAQQITQGSGEFQEFDQNPTLAKSRKYSPSRNWLRRSLA